LRFLFYFLPLIEPLFSFTGIPARSSKRSSVLLRPCGAAHKHLFGHVGPSTRKGICQSETRYAKHNRQFESLFTHRQIRER
jgi:hypothetical protein